MKRVTPKSSIGGIISYSISKSLKVKMTIITLSMVLMSSHLPYSTDSKSLVLNSEMSSNSAHHGFLKLRVDSNNSHFSTDIYFNENATLGLDPGYDALIFGGNAPAFSIYSKLVEDITDGLPFSLQALSETAMDNVTIPIGLNASQGEDLMFSISQTDLPDYINISIEDAETGSITLLNNSHYQITTSTALNGYGRFYLRIESNALDINESTINNLNIYTDYTNKTININGKVNYPTEMKLYDLTGKFILENILDSNRLDHAIDVSNLDSGIYILALIDSTNQQRIEKLIIK